MWAILYRFYSAPQRDKSQVSSIPLLHSERLKMTSDFGGVFTVRHFIQRLVCIPTEPEPIEAVQIYSHESLRWLNQYITMVFIRMISQFQILSGIKPPYQAQKHLLTYQVLPHTEITNARYLRVRMMDFTVTTRRLRDRRDDVGPSVDIMIHLTS